VFFVDSINRFIKRGEKRSATIKKNIVISFLIRSLSISINLSVVSLALNYVNPVQYGIWLTITSIISWFTYFDFGMGNGLRNKLANAVAFEEYDKAKKYVSTTYAIFTIIAASFFILFCLINPYINWNAILNVPSSVHENIHLVLLILLGTLCIQFIVQLINTVLNAVQETAKAEFVTLLAQLGMLITLVVLKFTTNGSLRILIIALNIVPLAVIFLAGLFFYSSRHKLIAPSLKSIDFSYVKSILNLGGIFFLIQMGSMILFQTDNIIITRVLGPEAVTKFNVTYKLYSVITVVFSIIAVPYWSAFTEAWAKKDYQWISGSIRRLREVWLFTSFVVVPVFFLLSKFFFKIWLPPNLNINLPLSISMALYVISSSCLSFSCYFLYGIGKLRVLLILYLLIAITNVPLGIIMGKALGIEGVILANVVAFVLMSIVLWVQTNKILGHRAFGIWNL
jgi:O-antigen/teichoic acid export membrane protein